jgi:hypothetical protein
MKTCETCGQEMPVKPKEPKKPKIKKFKGSGEQWLKAAAILAFSYVPTVYHCQHCEYPVVEGYCCPNCGADDPGDSEADGESTHYLFSWP